MRAHTLLGRGLLAVALAGFGLALTAGPATAAPGGDIKIDDIRTASLEIFQPGFRYIAAGAAAKPYEIQVYNASDVVARDVTVRIDTARLPETVTAAFPEGCKAEGKAAVCTVPELAARSSRSYRLGLRADASEPAFFSGEVVTTASAANSPQPTVKETWIGVAMEGVDLAVADIPGFDLKAGASEVVPIEVTNNGNVPAKGLIVRLSTSSHLELPNAWTNCRYFDDYRELLCNFDVTIPVGGTVRIDPRTPLTLKVEDTAAGPDIYGAYVDVWSHDDEGERPEGLPGPGGAKPAKLVTVDKGRAKAAEIDTTDNSTNFEVRVPRTVADTQAVGATVEGAIGDTRTVTVGMRNAGPSNQLTPDEDWAPAAVILLPAGVQAVESDDQCVPLAGDEPDWEHQGEVGGLSYYCWPSAHVPAGKTYEWVFQVKIAAAPSTPGVILVDGGVQDPDTGNDFAPITLVLSGVDGGAGGGLPVTGASTAAVAGAGALLLAGGALAFVTARRRRIVTRTH